LTDPASLPDPRIHPILKRCLQGPALADAAACEIQERDLEGYHAPSAGDVPYWARATGIGIPR